MTLEHLKLFRDIARTRNVSHGAEVCGMSQSAASQCRHEAERLLGSNSWIAAPGPSSSLCWH
jgi:DNA-binding transcriptional LysR family regulator